ncbi:MAG: sigma-54-dependent transcriptional regulator [Spirochaetaceae bacterium]
MIRVVLVDHDRGVHDTLRRLLPQTCTLLSYFRGVLAGDYIRQHQPHAVFIGLDLSDVSVDELVASVVGLRRSPPVSVIGHSSQAAEVVAAMRAGAKDCLLRPFGRSEVEVTLARLLHASCSSGNGDCGNGHSGNGHGEPRRGDAADRLFHGRSDAVRSIREFVRRVAHADIPVLLLGESGSGKEVAARAIHELFSRSESPFVAANCGAIPEPLFESEMFGAEKGAFTDAVARPGYLERAVRGTMFLDEVGEMSSYNQAKILRVIEDRRVRRLGGSRELHLSFRLIAASNRDLPAEVRLKRFRRDLYYRLNVLTHRMPDLTDRLEDIPDLVESFLREAELEDVDLTDNAYDRLAVHTWPGNVRELRNVLLRAAVMKRGSRITADDITFV